VQDPILPPTEKFQLAPLGIELDVWSGCFDIVIPIYATGELASETRPLDVTSVPIEVSVAYQACDENECLLPRREVLTLEVPLDLIDIPKIGLHVGHGQREGNYDGSRHVRRLALRKIRESPFGFLRFLVKSVRLEWAARKRRKQESA
jgi:hypothetical protein